MLQGEYSAILSTFIKLPFVIKTCLSIFEWPLKSGFFFVLLTYDLHVLFCFLFRGDDSESDEEKDPDKKKFENSLSGEITMDRQQSKTLLTMTIVDQKWLETVFLITICCQSGDK